MDIFYRRLFAVLIYMTLHISCHDSLPQGYLKVVAPDKGSFEIYRIGGDKPLQFVSEEIGSFNETIPLDIGSYLILADCSHEMIVINHNQLKTLTSHHVEFQPPLDRRPGDKFSIQCSRFPKTKAMQHLQNRFKLNILHGKRDLLVGMVPLAVDFTSMDQPDLPKQLTYELSAIQLSSYPGMSPKTLFFTSPADDLIAITEHQDFGHWLFLLPGDYIVEVNGTKTKVSLRPSQTEIIEPAFLRVETDSQVDLEVSSDILGSPLYVALNDHHWLDLNETYPVLPGYAKIKLNGSHKNLTVALMAKQLTKKEVRSVHVALDCSPWDWDCLGRRKVFLYEENKPYAFAEGMTDVPILFFKDNVWVSVQGSRDIRYQLADDKRNSKLKVGWITLTPEHRFRLGQVTDLVRIEAMGKPFQGHTLDVPLDEEISIPLIEGSFYLAQYTSHYGQEYERRNSRRVIKIRQKVEYGHNYKVYVTEKKFKKIRQAMLKKKQKPSLQAKQSRQQQVESIITTTIY